jgi:hypothetical protein
MTLKLSYNEHEMWNSTKYPCETVIALGGQHESETA